MTLVFGAVLAILSIVSIIMSIIALGKEISQELKYYVLVSLYFPITSLDASLTACIAVAITPIYYFKFRWNKMYPYFVIVRFINLMGNFVGILINAYIIYKAGMSKSAILANGIPLAFDAVGFA